MSILCALLLLVSPLQAQRAAQLYQAALVMEKGAGNADSAAALYRQVLAQRLNDAAALPLAIRAEQRLRALGSDSTSTKIDQPLRRLSAQISLHADTLRSPTTEHTAFALGRHRLRAPDAPMDKNTRTHALTKYLRAARAALGLNGLVEYVDAVLASKRHRQPQPQQLFLAGLYHEQERASCWRAGFYYRQGLAQMTPPPLYQRLQTHLARCQQASAATP